MHGGPRLRPLAPAVAAVAALLLAACGGGEPEIPAGPDADDPACTQLLNSAPRRVLDQARLAAGTPVPGVMVWGSPGIVLRCGAEPGGPTTLPCLEINGVDWVVDDAGDPIRFRTYGREPAVEVLVPTEYGRENASGALVDLEPVVSRLPQTRRCLGPQDPATTP